MTDKKNESVKKVSTALSKSVGPVARSVGASIARAQRK